MAIGDPNKNPYDDIFGVLTQHPDSPLSGTGSLVRPIGAPSAPAISGGTDPMSNTPGGIGGTYQTPEEMPDSAVGKVHPAFFTPQEEGIHNGFLRKLAKTGDVLGSIFAPGAMAAIPGTVLNERQAEARKLATESEEAKTAEQQARTRQVEKQTDMLGKTVRVTDAHGNAWDIPEKDIGKYAIGENANATKENVADTNAQSKKDIEQMREEIAKGNVTRQLFDPATQETVFYNKQGDEVKRVKGQYNASSWLPKSSSTEQIMTDAEGNIVRVPKTTVSAPVVPAIGSGQSVPLTPSRTGKNAAAQTQKTNAPSRVRGAATPVLDANGQPLQGKGAIDFQTKKNNIDETASAFGDYQKDYNELAEKLTPADRDAMRILINQTPPTHGFVESLPLAGPVTDAVNALIGGTITSDQYKNMSPAAQKLFLDYYNTLAHHFAYLKATQGSIGRNPQMIQAEMHTVPLPYVDKGPASEALSMYMKRIQASQKPYHHGEESNQAPHSPKGKAGDPLGIF